MSTPLDSRVRQYDGAIANACRYLRTRINDDGSVDGVNEIWGYYSQPLALVSGGSTSDWHCANRLLDHVSKRFLSDEGFLLIDELPGVGDFYPYPYLIRGATTWGAYDIAHQLMATVLRHQDQSGGILYRQDSRRLIDPAVTPHGGIAMLATGHVREARRAGDFLVRLHDVQPEPDTRYFTVWDADLGEPVSDYEGLVDVPWGGGSILIKANPDGANAYWDIGFTLAFLSGLYRVTRLQDYLRVATELFDILVEYDGFLDHVWKTPWGCAALYGATHDDKYLAASIRMADSIVKSQQTDGGYFLGSQSNFVDEGKGNWSRGFETYEDLGRNLPILVDTVSQMTHYLAQVRAVMPTEWRANLDDISNTQEEA